MKYFIKKIYLILFFIFILFFSVETFAKESKIKYFKGDISNYFLGIISANQDHTSKAYKYLNKVQSLKNRHDNFKIQFLRTLILLEKFDKAFSFSQEVWNKNELFFEADLLLGLESFINKDYLNAKRHFERLNKTYSYNNLFGDFLGNFLLASVKAAENNQDESFELINKISKPYNNLKRIQSSFLQCYFDLPKTEESFTRLTNDTEFNFLRYNFFLSNYLLHKNKNTEARKVVNVSRKKNNSNILLKQTENFILSGETEKIKKFFNCKNLEDSLAEIFYIIANLYSTEEDYKLSNFYLRISLFLNNKFIPNKSLLAENFFYQKKFDLSKKVYNSLKSIGSIYSWHASKSIAIILSETISTKHSISNLEKEFNLLSDPNFEHYYELANFYKDNEYYEESIKYYFLVLKNIKTDHYLVPQILDRRGTSYERIGDWEKAEKDLKESLRIEPDQPHVLNYLAYSWIEKGINIDKALEMLKRATKLKKNDGYIIDSLGWAYYMNKNYNDAEKFLQKAVELKPLDPIINDHYADTLWMVNKNIQARYFWKHVLSLDDTEEELRNNINKKLIFGINKKL